MNRQVVLALLTLFSALSQFAHAQQSERKASKFSGTVEEVNSISKRIRVTNEPIPGGMGAMNMNYSVDKEEVIGQLKTGDHITATFYEGEMMLHSVQIMSSIQAATQIPDSPQLGLEDLERMALAGNPTLAQAEANIRVSAGQARQAGLYPNPTVGYYGDEIRGGYYGGGKQGGFVSQTIVMGGKLRAARHVAELTNQESKTSGEAQRLRILNNVRTMFFQVLAAQRLLEVRQTLAKLAADATETANQLANVGQADLPDVLQAEVEQQQMNVSLRLSQQSLRASWRMLAALIGKSDLPQTRLDGDLEAIPDLNYEDWLATT